MKEAMMKYKTPLLALIGAVALIGVTCGITGCSSGSGSGGADDVQTVPISPDDTQTTQDSDTVAEDTANLPPDPGEAGKQTLAGIDVNNNGVRDDVEIAIYHRYPNQEDAPKRDALMRGAYVLQQAILVGGAILDGTGSEDDAFRVDEKTGLVTECLIKRFPSRAHEELSFLELVLTNTPERGRAYDKYNAALSGSFFGLPDTGTPCEDIDISF